MANVDESLASRELIRASAASLRLSSSRETGTDRKSGRFWSEATHCASNTKTEMGTTAEGQSPERVVTA